MQKPLVAITLAALLAACSTTEPAWQREATSLTLAQRDIDECLYDAAKAATGTAEIPGVPVGTMANIRQGELHGLCMKARGYHIVQIPK